MSTSEISFPNQGTVSIGQLQPIANSDSATAFATTIAQISRSELDHLQPNSQASEEGESATNLTNMTEKAVASVKKKKKKKSHAKKVEANAQKTVNVSERHGLFTGINTKDGMPFVLGEEMDRLGIKGKFFSDSEKSLLQKMFARWHLGSKMHFLMVWELHVYTIYNELISKLIEPAVSHIQSLRDQLLSQSCLLTNYLFAFDDDTLKEPMIKVQESLEDILASMHGFIIVQSKSSKLQEHLNVKRNLLKDEIITCIQILLKIISESEAENLICDAEYYDHGNLLDSGTFDQRLDDIIKLAEYLEFTSNLMKARPKCMRIANEKIKSLSTAVKVSTRKKEDLGKKFLEVRNWFKMQFEELEKDMNNHIYEFCKLKELSIAFESYVIPSFFPYSFSDVDGVIYVIKMYNKFVEDNQNLKSGMGINFSFDKKTDITNKELIGLVEQIQEDHRELFFQYFKSLSHMEISQYLMAPSLRGLRVKASDLLPYFNLFEPEKKLGKLAEDLKKMQYKHEALIAKFITQLGLKDKQEIKRLIRDFKENCSLCSQYIASFSVMLKYMMMLSKFEGSSEDILKGKVFSVLPELINYMELDTIEQRLSSLFSIPVEALVDAEIVTDEIMFNSNPSAAEEEKEKEWDEKVGPQTITSKKKKAKEPKYNLDDVSYPSKGISLPEKVSSKQEKSDRGKTWKVLQRLRSYGCFSVEGTRHTQVRHADQSSFVTLLSRSSKDSIPAGTMSSINRAVRPFKAAEE